MQKKKGVIKRLDTLGRFPAQRVAQKNISCTSMIVTLFGDVAAVHGGWIWLGSLIEVLAPMGYSERLVRTAVYRLMQQDWLRSKKVGRKSYYSISESSWGYHEKAARRIYAAGRAEWDGSWVLVVPVDVEGQREELKKSLLWMGFNTLVNGLYAHPSLDTRSLDETLYENDLHGKVIVLSARTADIRSQQAIKALVNSRWAVKELEESYSDFIESYVPVTDPDVMRALCEKDQFLLRVLMIQEFRRILLKDPDLPRQMLPNGWAGDEAHQLLKRSYSLLSKGSTQFICNEIKNAQGNLPEPSLEFIERFGGL